MKACIVIAALMAKALNVDSVAKKGLEEASNFTSPRASFSHFLNFSGPYQCSSEDAIIVGGEYRALYGARTSLRVQIVKSAPYSNF